MTVNEIAKEAISRINKRITNEVFSVIQNDRNLMHEYLKAVERDGLTSVNQTIGKAIKTSYDFINLDDRENNPSCTIIQSHMKFKQ